jgi:hypothetical protein
MNVSRAVQLFSFTVYAVISQKLKDNPNFFDGVARNVVQNTAFFTSKFA